MLVQKYQKKSFLNNRHYLLNLSLFLSSELCICTTWILFYTYLNSRNISSLDNNISGIMQVSSFSYTVILLKYESNKIIQTNKCCIFKRKTSSFPLKHLKAADRMPKKCSMQVFAYLVWMLETVAFEIRNCHWEYKWHNLPIFLWAKKYKM